MPLMIKPLATISRNHISLLIHGSDIQSKTISVPYTFDTSLCPNECKYKNNKLFCKDCPSKNLIKIDNETLDLPHIIIKKEIQKKENKKLSKYQILQYILYHFLPLTKEGDFSYILEKDLATKLNCSIKTIKRNNEVLKSMGLINYTYDDYGIISIAITNYQESFKTKNDNGKGGISIPLEFLDKLIDSQNIDYIRFSLFTLEKCYSGEGVYGETYKYKIVTSKLKNLLSKGKQYRKKIFSILKNIKDIVNIEVLDDINKESPKIISAQLNKDFSNTHVKKRVSENILNAIFNKAEERKLDLHYLDIDDLTSLAYQYGIDPVLKALNEYLVPLRSKAGEMGATIRNIIMNNYYLPMEI